MQCHIALSLYSQMSLEKTKAIYTKIIYIKFNPPNWQVGVTVLPPTAEIDLHLFGRRVLMSSPIWFITRYLQQVN